MAKINKSKAMQKKRSAKECFVKLTRLSRETIEGYLNPNHITYNISAKIRCNKMNIGQTTVTSEDNSFNIDVKVSASGISISQSEIGPSQPIIQSSLPKVAGRILRPRLQATVAPALRSNTAATALKSNSTVAKLQSQPKLVDAAWQKCKVVSRDTFAISIDDIVTAKMKGHLPWPAIVREIVNKNRVKVEFYGTQINERYGFISITEIIPFGNSFDVIRLALDRNNLKFNKAVREAEIACGILPQASIVHNNH